MGAFAQASCLDGPWRLANHLRAPVLAALVIGSAGRATCRRSSHCRRPDTPVSGPAGAA
jgi:hypothetical protein